MFVRVFFLSFFTFIDERPWLLGPAGNWQGFKCLVSACIYPFWSCGFLLVVIGTAFLRGSCERMDWQAGLTHFQLTTSQDQETVRRDWCSFKDCVCSLSEIKIITFFIWQLFSRFWSSSSWIEKQKLMKVFSCDDWPKHVFFASSWVHKLTSHGNMTSKF